MAVLFLTKKQARKLGLIPKTPRDIFSQFKRKITRKVTRKLFELLCLGLGSLSLSVWVWANTVYQIKW